jgi:hypothetical protein
MGVRVVSQKWNYPTRTVTVGDNSQRVRCLTVKERSIVMDERAKMTAGAAGAATASELAIKMVQFASIDPKLTVEEVEQMPPDLLDACAADIMEMTNGKKAEAAEETSESSSQPTS